MKALCWTGVNKLQVENVDDPAILNAQDIIVRVLLSTSCGSDLHLLGGYVPTMRAGDVLGHEFLGEVVETGSAVTKHRVGDRVVVCSFISCGKCWYFGGWAGSHAEYIRVPYADQGAFAVPEGVAAGGGRCRWLVAGSGP